MQQWFYKILITWILVGFSLKCIHVGADESHEAARQTVEAYCKAEFEADEFDRRKTLVKFSPKRQAQERAKDPLFHGSVILWGADPLFVVASYKVMELQFEKERATAAISYRRLARSEGQGKIIADYKDNDLVKVNLVYADRQWWILDPPPPHVSKEALIGFYEASLKNYGENWLERSDISEPQKQSYRRYQQALRALKNLSD